MEAGRVREMGREGREIREDKIHLWGPGQEGRRDEEKEGWRDEEGERDGK